MAVNYYVFETATGKLVSRGTTQPGQLRPGLEYKEIDDPAPQDKIWDEGTQTLVAKPGRRIIGVDELFERLTEREVQTLLGMSEGSAPSQVRALSRYVRLSKRIDLDGVILREALVELGRLNLLSSRRQQELREDG